MPIIKRWNKSAKNSFCHFGFRRNNRIFALPNRCVGRVVRRRSAKPVTVVRFRYAPQKTPLRLSQGRLLYPIFPQCYYNIATLSLQQYLPIATSV